MEKYENRKIIINNIFIKIGKIQICIIKKYKSTIIGNIQNFVEQNKRRIIATLLCFIHFFWKTIKREFLSDIMLISPSISFPLLLINKYKRKIKKNKEE